MWRIGRQATCVGLLLCGCTAESTRIAIEAQQRANLVEQAIFERQHEGLRVLLYRDLVRRLGEIMADGSDGAAGAMLRAVNDAWNERDLVEFWAVQHERAKALRTAGVDAKLYGSQAMVDLLIKALEAKGDRAAQGVAEAAGKRAEASGESE